MLWAGLPVHYSAAGFAGMPLLKSKISGSRSKVTINGAEADRKDLKQGMVCAITYKPGDKNEPTTMECEG